MTDMSAPDWDRRAAEELAAAQPLITGRHWQAAYHHAGFAVECALKGVIMRRLRLNRWPDRAERRALHTHDLRRLMALAGLDVEILHEITFVTDIGRAWVTINSWSNETRYDPRPFPEALATDIVWAAGEGGLVAWLLTR